MAPELLAITVKSFSDVNHKGIRLDYRKGDIVFIPFKRIPEFQRKGIVPLLTARNGWPKVKVVSEIETQKEKERHKTDGQEKDRRQEREIIKEIWPWLTI